MMDDEQTLYEQIINNSGNEFAAMSAETIKMALTEENVSMRDRLNAISLLQKLENSYLEHSYKKRKMIDISKNQVSIESIESRIKDCLLIVDDTEN